MSRHTKLAVAMGLALSMASAASWADQVGGWYFGVSGGQAKGDVSKAEFDEIVGATGLSGTSSLDDSDTSFSLFGGYRVSEYFSVEAGYVDLGTEKYRASVLLAPSVPATFSADFESKGFTAAAIGAVPIADSFDVHGRAGIFFADSKVSGRATISGSVVDAGSVSANSQDFFYGLGVGMQVGQNWSFSLDWQQFKDVGDDHDTGETDVDRLSLGVTYRL